MRGARCKIEHPCVELHIMKRKVQYWRSHVRLRVAYTKERRCFRREHSGEEKRGDGEEGSGGEGRGGEGKGGPSTVRRVGCPAGLIHTHSPLTCSPGRPTATQVLLAELQDTLQFLAGPNAVLLGGARPQAATAPPACQL